MNIFVTGGCGYKGTVLVPKLLSQGHIVTVMDVQWFGNYLDKHENLKIIKQDIRDLSNISLKEIQCVIHLASVANDPCGDLDPLLTWEVGALASMKLADKAAREGVKQFIYASSASVYGVRDEEQITEDLPLYPISVYNKTKMVAERMVLSYSDQMNCQIVRPATVCGLSKRLRLDVVVNLLTMQALNSGKITVLGGDQQRPNIHIEDITDLYCYLVRHPEITGIFNAGADNITVRSIAENIASSTNAEIIYKESNDPRSYRLNSDKLTQAGFTPKKTINDAIEEITRAFKAGEIEDYVSSYNVEWMRQTLLKNVQPRL